VKGEHRPLSFFPTQSVHVVALSVQLHAVLLLLRGVFSMTAITRYITVGIRSVRPAADSCKARMGRWKQPQQQQQQYKTIDKCGTVAIAVFQWEQ